MSAGAPLRQPKPAVPPPGPRPVEPPAPAAPEPRPWRGWLALFFVGGLMLGYTLYQQFSGFGPEAGQAAIAELETARVVQGDLPRTIRVGGTITARSFAAITAPRLRLSRRLGGGAGAAGGGRGSQMTLVSMAEPGSSVEAGQIVAEFDRQSQQQYIDDQQALLTQAESQIKFTESNLAIQMETLRQEARVAKAEFGKAELDLRTAEVRSAIEAEILKLSVDETQATWEQLDEQVRLTEVAHQANKRQFEIDRDQQKIDLTRAEMNAGKMVVRTPIGGTVVMMTIFRGGTFAQVEPGDEVYPGAYFMQIVDPTQMQLEATVNQADVQHIRPGQNAEIRLDAYEDKVWPGRVVSVAAMTGAGGGSRRFRTGTGNYVRNITVTVDIEADDPLIIPDLSASADVLLKVDHDVLVAPREGLERQGDDWFAWVRRPGRGELERRPVTVGARNETHVVVESGLEEGDELALRHVEIAER